LWQKEAQAVRLLSSALEGGDDKERADLLEQVSELGQAVYTEAKALRPADDVRALHEAQLDYAQTLGALSGAWNLDQPEKGQAALLAVDKAYARVLAAYQSVPKD
jgi:hypothetical protein